MPSNHKNYSYRKGLLTLCLFSSIAGARAGSWPDLSQQAARQGGGETDSALIIAVEKYAAAPPIPGAVENATDWYLYLTKSLGIKPSSITILRDSEATIEKIRRHLTSIAQSANPKGKLWIVFIGHGAPSPDGKDGVLVGFDAQQDAESLYARSLKMAEVLSIARAGRQAHTVVVVDTCFSGRLSTTQTLIAGLQPLVSVAPMAATSNMTILTAAKADQFAGPLLGVKRPAFSYLVLGSLRGWADQDKDGKVTAREVFDYVRDALTATIKGRSQEPELISANPELLLADSAKESGPDLASIVVAPQHSEITFSTVGEVRVPNIAVKPVDLNFEKVNLKAEQLLEQALELEENQQATSKAKMKSWCDLALVAPASAQQPPNPYQKQASAACEKWRKYVSVHEGQLDSLNRDYATLEGYIALKRKTREQKISAAEAFLAAYDWMGNEGKVQKAKRFLAGLKFSTMLSSDPEACLAILKSPEMDQAYMQHFGQHQISSDWTMAATPKSRRLVPRAGERGAYYFAQDIGSTRFFVPLEPGDTVESIAEKMAVKVAEKQH